MRVDDWFSQWSYRTPVLGLGLFDLFMKDEQQNNKSVGDIKLFKLEKRRVDCEGLQRLREV